MTSSSIFDSEKWYRNRIIWKAGQHKLTDKEVMDFLEASQEKKDIVLSHTVLRGECVLLFWEKSDLWTVLTTREVVSNFLGAIESIELDAIENKVKTASMIHTGEIKKSEADILKLGSDEVTIWAPRGAPLFALANILKMFPLKIPR